MNRLLSLLLVIPLIIQVQAGLVPSRENLMDKFEGKNNTEKGNMDDEPIDAKYFDDITRIIKHLDFEKATPRAVEMDEVSYYLYTRDNADENHTRFTNENLESLNIKRKNIVFIVHGWTGNREKKWYQDLTDAILNTTDVAVVQVDWRAPAGDLYAVAALNVRDVGSILGYTILTINNRYNVDFDKINIIGHSLGAQVAGFAGKYIRNATNQQIAKIFALDPAGPLFRHNEPSDRLTDTDAKSVVVLHTDGGVFGYGSDMGTVDFYPNGGTAIQPGCLDVSKLTLKTITSPLFCSHQRAYKYFVDAFTPPGFIGVQCESYSKFKDGECKSNKTLALLTDDLSTRGSFYFRTNSESPFIKNDQEE